MNNYDVNIKTILESKLGFEAHFVLYCIHNKTKDLIVQYTNQCKKINTDIFKSLESDGYLNITTTDTDKIYFELLSLTDKGQCLIASVRTLTSEKQFEEFKTFYPNKVKNGVEIRRLHGNLRKCKTSYEKLLLETSHDILCKCAKLYHNEKIRSNSEIYMQNLETWLNQKNYLQYVDDVTTNQIEQQEPNNLDAI